MCVLAVPEIAEIVQNALLHFDGQRYHLSAWCIMPNHVHLIVTPIGEYTLSQILHSWKSFSANKINEFLKRKGSLWKRESFDHLIRSVDHWEAFILYIEENPVKANLCRSKYDWKFSSCGFGYKRSSDLEFIKPYYVKSGNYTWRGELPHITKNCGTYFVTFSLIDLKPGY